MTELQQKIWEWAEDAVAKYLNMVRGGWDYGFYTQSDLRTISESPEYFIIQINPGSGGTYSQQRMNDYWDLNGQDMDAAHFIKGNYGVNPTETNKKTAWERRMEWSNFRKLRTLFSRVENGNPLDDTKKFILTNASPFNTVHAAKEVYETLPKTLPIALSLIDITHPKRIIVLGCELRPYFSRIVKDCEVKETSLSRIYYGEIHGIETLFIDHPSARTSKEGTKNVLRLWNTMPLEEAIGKASA